MIVRYSMLDEYTRCPASCKRKYIDGIKEPDTSATHFGTALHLAIKTGLEGGDGIEVFDMYWNSIKGIPDLKYYRHDWTELRGLAINTFLPNFFKTHSKHFEETLQEEELSMPIPGGHTLQGTYDCKAKHKSLLTIADWKTSTKLYRDDKILRNPQLWLYAALYRHKYGVLPEQIMYKVFVKNEYRIQTFIAHVTEAELARQLDNCYSIVRSLVHSIETNNWWHSFECYCER